MSKKETNIFLIWTEYHLFTTITLIVNNFQDDDKYENIILHPSTVKGSRISEDIHIGFNASFHRLISDHTKINRETGLKEILDEHLRKNVKRLYTFFEQRPIPIYCIYRLRKRAKVILCPDGNKPYLQWDKVSLSFLFKKTVKNYIYLFINRMWVFGWYKMSLRYAAFADIDEVLLQEPKLYVNHTSKKLAKINVLGDVESKKVLAGTYGFSFESEGLPSSDVVFYLNNFYYKDESYHVEFDVLQEITEKYIDKKIIIKPHPLTPDFQLDRFQGLKNVIIYNAKYPAELIISQLKNSTILSFWSAALMVNNSDCAFYWLHPIMRKRNGLHDEFDVLNPTKHIKTISDLAEIAFPNVSLKENNG